MAPGRRVLMVAGEASGEMHGARLARALWELDPGLAVSGVGGRAMQQAGVEILIPSEDLTLVGFAEVLPKLRVILGALKKLKQWMAKERPALVILIDFPDFNFRVAKAAKALGLKVLYYISPQVWAWRQGRARKMASLVDRLAVVFPFEPEFFAKAAPHLPVSFVGHPLLDDPQVAQIGPLPCLPVPAEAELVGLLPGSRHSEINRLLPLQLAAAGIMQKERSGLHFVLPVAPSLRLGDLEPFLPQAPKGLTILEGRAFEVMRASRVLLVASGTATLQAALAGTPMVVVYKTGVFNYLLARSLIKVPFIAMPNLIFGACLAPELIQGAATPEALAQEGLALLGDEARRQEVVAGLTEVRRRLGGPGASRRTAELALTLMAENPA